jgi:RND family efflux transporter MFP subunit
MRLRPRRRAPVPRLKQQERLLDQAQVRSPLDGGVQRVLVHPGERVSAGAELVEVIRGGSLDFVAQATADQLARLKTGQAVLVTPEGSTEGQEGRVHATAPAVDSASNAGAVVIRIARAGPGLLPGAGATARVNLGRKDKVLVIPDSALVLVGDVMSVFVVGADSGSGSPRHRRSAAEWTRRGFRGYPGRDRVVTTGAYGLSDGMRVAPSYLNECGRIRGPAPGCDLPRGHPPRPWRGVFLATPASRYLSRGHLPADRDHRAGWHV